MTFKYSIGITNLEFVICLGMIRILKEILEVNAWCRIHLE